MTHEYAGGGTVLWGPSVPPGKLETFAILVGPTACVITLLPYDGPTLSAVGWDAFERAVLECTPLAMLTRPELTLHLDDGEGAGFVPVKTSHPLIRANATAVAVLSAKVRQEWPEWDAAMAKAQVPRIPIVKWNERGEA